MPVTVAERAAYRQKLADAIRAYTNLENETVARMGAAIRDMRRELQDIMLSLPNDAEFQRLAITGLQQNLNVLEEKYRAQLTSGLTQGLLGAADAGAAAVADSLALADLASFFRPSRAQFQLFVDMATDLISRESLAAKTAIANDIRRVALMGGSPLDAMRAIDKRLGFRGNKMLAEGLSARAERIYRTELNRGFNAASQAQLEMTAQANPDVQLKKRWVATGDGRTRWSHLAAHGQEVGVDESFIVGGERLKYPLDPAGSAGNTINCLLPGNDVMAAGLQAASRAGYCGPALELVTATGKRLTVTPNHPILTPAGFIPANLLQEGDYVISSGRCEEVLRAIDPDDDYVPTAIEEKWRSLLVVGDRGHMVRPAMAHDFHGDGRFMDGDVDVVTATRLLRREVRDAAFGQHVDENALGRRLVLERRLVGGGPAQEFVLASSAAADGSMGIGGELPPFGRAEALHPDAVRLADAARGYASFEQMPAESRPGDASLAGESLFGFPFEVTGQPDVKARNGLAPVGVDDDTALSQVAEQGGVRDAALARDFLSRFSALVEPDQLVTVREFHFTGHVYDLQTSTGLYPANSIFVHNCRCRALLILPEFTAVTSATDASVARERGRRETANATNAV